MANGNAVAGLTQRDIAAILGRNQGPEIIQSLPFAVLTSPILNNTLNLNRPMERLHIRWRGRVTITVANFTTVAAEAPVTILQSIMLKGAHRLYGSLTPADLSGADIFALARLTRNRGCSLFINGVRQPEPDIPYGQIGATFGNIGTYDIEIHYDLPLTPILPPGGEIVSLPFMYTKRDWQDTLQLRLFFGDATSFGTPNAATVVAFSAFGSAVGTPTVDVCANYVILGPLADSLSPGVVVRNAKLVTAGLAANVASGLQLGSALDKQKTTNIFVKTGLLLAGTSAGVTVFQTLSDDILDLTQPVVDNKPIRDTFNNRMSKEWAGYLFGTVLPQGYLNFTFVNPTNVLSYYRGDQVGGGATFVLNTGVIGAAANATAEVIQEEVIGTPMLGGA